VKKFYFVVGGESTGTKLTTEILIHGGCKGDAGDVQLLDDVILNGDRLINNSSYVWRRSVPHANKWWDLSGLYRKFQEAGGFQEDEGMFVVTTRNFPATARSQVERRHVNTLEDSYCNLRRAYSVIFKYIENVKQAGFVIVSFDLLVASPHLYLPLLYDDLGISLSKEKVEEMAHKVKKDVNESRMINELNVRGLV